MVDRFGLLVLFFVKPGLHNMLHRHISTILRYVHSKLIDSSEVLLTLRADTVNFASDGLPFEVLMHTSLSDVKVHAIVTTPAVATKLYTL